MAQKIKPCRLIARMIALIYNWWSLFVRLVEPDKHYEAIVSRPLLLHGVGKQTTHAAQKTLTITSTHGRASYVRAAYQRVCQFFEELKAIAPQLTPIACWYRILSKAMKKYLNGMILKPANNSSLGEKAPCYFVNESVLTMSKSGQDSTQLIFLGSRQGQQYSIVTH